MSRTRIIGGKLTEIIGGDYNIYSAGDIVYNSAKTISFTGKDGVIFGKPEKAPARTIEESEYKLESTYVHDHLKSVASEMTSKFDVDNKSIVYKFYKEITDGIVINPAITVSKYRLSSKIAFYDDRNEKIIVWQESLIDIEKDIDKKIILALALTEAYGVYIDIALKEKLNPDTNLETYEYDLFRFDAVADQVVVIAKIESPNYTGNLDITFPKTESKKSNQSHNNRDKNSRGGPSAGDFDQYDESDIDSGNLGGPGDPIPNMALVFKYSLGGGFSASICAGIQKNIDLGKDWGLSPSLNGALTYYGYGTPGTSRQSRNLVTASLTPTLTLGGKTGNTLPLNLFNQYTATGVNVPYEYAFSLGSTGIISSGRVTSEYDEKGNRIKDPYNSHDNKNRNQIIGGAAIKVGNFMISSYNDIYKPILFFGMDSDQYWSAGVNIQAKLTQKINLSYAFDLYYGKSNNKNPFALDKNINGQNYDHQKLFDVLLNRGQETFSIFDENGNIKTTTKFGYGTFWPSNKMHNAIPFPDVPKEPKKPTKPFDDTNDRLNKKYNEDKIQYEIDLKKYEEDVLLYQMSINMKANPTFHHLYLVYKEGSKEVNLQRLKTYTDATLPSKTKLLQEFYELERINKKIEDDKKSNK
ncbi:polymorphic toxin type 23 domain-containing protein [Flavobacterium sp.]|uniref:polymorphic toxin type 23 domain-containing protein n=1 Tax=Flavobacterium sp. TaxID=239 RepID=UPI00286E6F0E|nr:polymorphic toxin type 23 domain-containing protein [Flavobacterium sp.]